MNFNIYLKRWDLISNAEVHILYKLHQFLKSNPSDVLIDIAHNGFQCQPQHQEQQDIISRYISMDICSEIEWSHYLSIFSHHLNTLDHVFMHAENIYFSYLICIQYVSID